VESKQALWKPDTAEFVLTPRRISMIKAALVIVALLTVPAVADNKNKEWKERDKDRREAVREAAKDRREAMKDAAKDRREQDKEWREYLKEQRKAEKEWSKATRKERDDYEAYRRRRSR
jgi:hypothetical protein